MTIKESIQLVDPTAKFYTWGDKDSVAGWVKGNGWETKITYSESRAWEIAAELIAASPIQLEH